MTLIERIEDLQSELRRYIGVCESMLNSHSSAPFVHFYCSAKRDTYKLMQTELDFIHSRAYNAKTSGVIEMLTQLANECIMRSQDAHDAIIDYEQSEMQRGRLSGMAISYKIVAEDINEIIDMTVGHDI